MHTLIRGNRSGRLVTFDLTRTVLIVFAFVLIAQVLVLAVRATCEGGAQRHALVTFGRTGGSADVDDPGDDIQLSFSSSLSDAFRDALDPCGPIEDARPIPKGAGVKGKLFYWMKRRQRKQAQAANRDEIQTIPEPPVPNNLQRNQSLRTGIRF
jgi:hypothetical protein